MVSTSPLQEGTDRSQQKEKQSWSVFLLVLCTELATSGPYFLWTLILGPMVLLVLAPVRKSTGRKPIARAQPVGLDCSSSGPQQAAVPREVGTTAGSSKRKKRQANGSVLTG